jgi:hypothetical protein
MELLDWAPGMRVGGGYDVVRGEEKQEAVLGELVKPVNASGQQGEMTFVLATTSEEVDTALGVDASIKVGVGPFGGSAKMQFHSSCKVSNEATFCVLSVNATNAFEQLSRPVLSSDAMELLAAGKTDRFRERFGDSFVSGQFSGVEFRGVVRIEASKVERQKQIAAEVQASYGFMASGKASTEFKESMSSASHRIEIMVYQTGGEISICTSLAEMLAAARKALDDCRNGKAYPFQVTIDPYTELKLPNDGASLIDTEMAAKCVKTALAYIADLKARLNDIDCVRRNQEWYELGAVTMASLNEKAQAITQEINRLWEGADVCSRHFDRCAMAVPNFPDFVMPKRKDDAPPVAAPKPAGNGHLIGNRLLSRDLVMRKLTPGTQASLTRAGVNLERMTRKLKK